MRYLQLATHNTKRQKIDKDMFLKTPYINTA